MAEQVQATIGRIFYLRMKEGENPHTVLKELVEANGVNFALVNAIGGFDYAKIGVFTGKEYDVNEVKPMEGHVLEVTGFQGNIVRSPDGKAYPHIHVVIARNTGEVYSGHLIEARIKPFLEAFIIEIIAEKSRVLELFKHRWS